MADFKNLRKSISQVEANLNERGAIEAAFAGFSRGVKRLAFASKILEAVSDPTNFKQISFDTLRQRRVAKDIGGHGETARAVDFDFLPIDEVNDSGSVLGIDERGQARLQDQRLDVRQVPVDVDCAAC